MSGDLSTKREVHWVSIIINLQVYISSLIGLHLAIHQAYWKTSAFGIFVVSLGTLGTTAGAHRLWAHRTFTASTPLRIFLMVCQTLGGHTSIYNWVKMHRFHHKYFKTDMDPYNPSKGFVYSHFTANNLHLSPAQTEALKDVDMSDLENDRIVMFQKKFFWLLYFIFAFLLPVNAPAEYWGESIVNSVFILGWLRVSVSYQISLLIHSATNVFDLSTTNKDWNESNLVFFIGKSYWISYHYLLPWDYQTGEFGKYGNDCCSKFIRVCAALELASDLKTTDSRGIREALFSSVNKKRSLEECLEDLAKGVPKDHFLMPSKFH